MDTLARELEQNIAVELVALRGRDHYNKFVKPLLVRARGDVDADDDDDDSSDFVVPEYNVAAVSLHLSDPAIYTGNPEISARIIQRDLEMVRIALRDRIIPRDPTADVNTKVADLHFKHAQYLNACAEKRKQQPGRSSREHVNLLATTVLTETERFAPALAAARLSRRQIPSLSAHFREQARGGGGGGGGTATSSSSSATPSPPPHSPL